MNRMQEEPVSARNRSYRCSESLVAEDMEPVRNTLVRLLKRKGLNVHSATNGRTAIETLSAKQSPSI